MLLTDMHPTVNFQTNTASDREVELDRTLIESVCVTTRQRKLPRGPFRSLGGYLDYAGWPECQRFMELDRAIRHTAQESQQSDSCADLDEPLALCPVEPCPETFDDGCRSRNAHLTADDPSSKCGKNILDGSEVFGYD